MTRARALLVVLLGLGLAGYEARTWSQGLAAVTSPLTAFGSNIGDDYFLATYSQFEQYWKSLAAESPRVRLVSIGTTEEGRNQWMAVISSPENLAQLDRYKAVSRRLALADVPANDAAALARQGKAVVWIDGGLHADETLGAQQLIELSYQLASRDDPETMRILRDVIVLLVHANPDGHALVADWYMRERDPVRRTLEGIPRAYQKYVGHDNNRDFFLASQAETVNMNRVLYKEWFPQIVFDHHQPGPPGTIMFAPPFRGPFNYVLDPLIPESLDLVGSAMQSRFAAEGKRGVTMREGATYSTWWNGGLRTSAYFHNQIGLLTETTGDPTPMDLSAERARAASGVDPPVPLAAQRWHFRQAVDYSMTANRAVLDFASRFRESLLLNSFTMASRAIEAGSRDSVLVGPHDKDPSHALDARAPRAYILPATQPDFPTATKFIDALLKSGIVVDRAAAPFVVNGVRYAAGSFVVKTAQPFRAHVLDMFEPQEYPDGEPPYDIAGWTLAFQMGVKFDRILESFDGPLERVDVVQPPRQTIAGTGSGGYLLRHHQNDAAVAVNRLLEAGKSVFWLSDRSLGSRDGTGSIYVDSEKNVREILTGAARDLGISVTSLSAPLTGAALRLRPARIALWDRYGGAPSSGWVRWLLERYEFPFDVVYVRSIEAADFRARYDVLILPDEAVPQRTDRTMGVPPEYRGQAGVLSFDRSIPALRQFAEQGGTVVLMGQAASMAPALGVPVEDAFAGEEGRDVDSRFSIPGAVLRVHVDNTTPLAYGFEPVVDVFFDNSPAFRLTDPEMAPVAWFGPSPLRSGWARAQGKLVGTAAAVEAAIGRGRVLVFGPQVTFRAQSQAAFKFLFNAIYYSTAQRVTLGTPAAIH